MLHNPNIYPFNYNNVVSDKGEQVNPVVLATRMTNNLGEYEIMDLIIKTSPYNEVKQSFPNYLKEIREKTEETYNDIISMYNLRNEKRVEFPVYVISSIMNAHVLNLKYKINDQHSIERHNLLIDEFMAKIDYSSAVGVTNAIAYLASIKNFNQSTWEILSKSLREKEFDPEFTQVTNRTPFLFRYKEVSTKEMKVSILDENINFFHSLGNQFIILGYKAVFQAYHYLKVAEANGVKNLTQTIEDLERKFRLYEKTSNWNYFNQHLI
jgi:hypothetical protein